MKRWTLCGSPAAKAPEIAQRQEYTMGQVPPGVGNGDMGRTCPGSSAAASDAGLAFQRLQVYRTRGGDNPKKLEKEQSIALTPETVLSAEDAKKGVVFVCPEKTVGKPWLGAGGSFTEAAAQSWSAMSPELQNKVIQLYFDPVNGHGYNLGRIPIGSSDFSEKTWDCGTGGELPEGDNQLNNFSLEMYETTNVFKMIRKAQEAMKDGGLELDLMGSPWSPPAWMKSNKNRCKGGKLLPECRPAWARHYVKFVKEMKKEGVNIWALSVQNEPYASQDWDSCEYNAAEEKDFVRDLLGPLLRDEGLGYVKVFAYDHNRDRILEWMQTITSDCQASEFFSGVCYHWYGDPRFETWPDRYIVPFVQRAAEKDESRPQCNELKGIAGWNNLRSVAELAPDKHILFSEGCQELGGRNLDEVKDQQQIGERYAMNFIHDINSGLEGCIDWNLCLNSQGGPNHQGNFCVAPIICNEQTGQLDILWPYYYIGHIARYIRPEALRVLSSSRIDALQLTSFLNKNGSVATVIMNPSDKDAEIVFKLAGTGTRPLLCAPLKIDAHSIVTLVADNQEVTRDVPVEPIAAGVMSATRTLFNQFLRN